MFAGTRLAARCLFAGSVGRAHEVLCVRMLAPAAHLPRALRHVQIVALARAASCRALEAVMLVVRLESVAAEAPGLRGGVDT
eukprot:CAMPEP_0179914270 /NCGR_PEP_ID=MMETSP0983-20121128/984_1 /TAXON_ID=483367 /ORGANISM="non described non described, Strain CCMP 2436" /LENGTH=81 /DNA_ID=CAMNT_0021816475 /DNA_START=800 /DNA_END=1041 /DNA_ORIENTATION=-